MLRAGLAARSGRGESTQREGNAAVGSTWMQHVEARQRRRPKSRPHWGRSSRNHPRSPHRAAAQARTILRQDLEWVPAGWQEGEKHPMGL